MNSAAITSPEGAPDASTAQRIQAALLAFFHRMGEAVGGFVLLAIYFLVLGPVALVARLVSDPLARRMRSSGFVAREDAGDELRAALRQG